VRLYIFIIIINILCLQAFGQVNKHLLDLPTSYPDEKLSQQVLGVGAIYCKQKDQNGKPYLALGGTGSLIHNSLVLSAAHVILGSDTHPTPISGSCTFNVLDRNGNLLESRNFTYYWAGTENPMTFVKTDQDWIILKLKSPISNVTPLNIHTKSTISLGEKIRSCFFNLFGEGYKIKRCIWGQARDFGGPSFQNNKNIVHTDLPLSFGGSGAPIMNAENEIKAIAVTSGCLENSNGEYDTYLCSSQVALFQGQLFNFRLSEALASVE